MLRENETERQTALHRYNLLDYQPDASLDRLTRIAAHAFSAPIALVMLLDGEHQSCESCHGIEAGQAILDDFFCTQAWRRNELIVIADAAGDARLATKTILVQLPQYRFCVAAPLKTTDGIHVGLICIVDSQPRFGADAKQITLLSDLADQVVELLEFHRQKQSLVDLSERLVQQSHHLESSRLDIDRWQRRAMHALEAGNMGYWERDAETDLITFSPALEAMLGIDHNAFDGTVEAWLRHVHPDDRQAIVNNIQQARETGKNYILKYRILTAEGEERWITTTGTYRKDSAGRFVGAHGVSWDSTATDLAAQKLKLSEELFRILSNAAPIGIFRSDLDGHILYANPAMATFNGAPEEELLNHKWLRFIHPEDRQQLLTALKDATDQQRAGDYLHRLLRPDGTIRWMQARSVPLRDEDGRVIGKVGMIDDVTEQRQMMEDLRKAKEAAEIANNAKDMFLANVSHELRTPLNGVLGMSDLLVDAGLTPEQLEMAEIVNESARGLLSVVNDMLDLSRIESGRLSIECRPFDLRTTISQTLSLFRAETHKRSLTLSLDYEAGLPDHYSGDAGRIRQILTNYLSNALKFTPRGEIQVQVSGQLQDGTAYVTIAVRDGGIGITANDQKKLFRPFSQVDSSTTRRNGGAGLGLAICKRLAELMQGSVGVESSLGGGSTFWVKLPLVFEPFRSELSRPERIQPNAFAGNRILVVEDNPVNQKVAVGVLRRLGWEADIAADGSMAIQLCKANSYAVILMDCQMPVMDGYAATRLIRSWEDATGRAAVPIVALTAHAMSGDKKRCVEAGMNDHLTKPFGLEELRATLERWAMTSSNDVRRL